MPASDFATSSYLYDLPPERIAQHARPRGESFLFVIGSDGSFSHRKLPDIVEYFSPGDVLVLNDTRVVAARLKGQRSGQGKVEILVLDFSNEREFPALAKPGKRLRPGTRIMVGESTLEVVGRNGDEFRLRLVEGPNLPDLLREHGQIPLPPYIHRPLEPDDWQRYQTVYATESGSVAAPTAGLHFTEEILSGIRARGVEVVRLTLHVGWGTFRPVRVPDIRDHRMEQEHYRIPTDTALAILSAKEQGRRVFVVGTTGTRALEAWALDQGLREAWTSLFIYPGHRFAVPDILLTNFHLPGATPIMLTAAFCGRETILRAYAEALGMDYAFGSYGDAMLIWHP